MELREQLWRLEGLPGVDQMPSDVVAEHPIGPDGSLVPSDDAVSGVRSEWEVGPIARAAPSKLKKEIAERYGDRLDSRDLNLVAAGAELAVELMRRWVQADGVPEETDTAES